MDDRSLVAAILILGIGLAGTYYYKTQQAECSPQQEWQQWEQEQPKPKPPEPPKIKPPKIPPPEKDDPRRFDRRDPRFDRRDPRWRGGIYGCYIPGD